MSTTTMHEMILSKKSLFELQEHLVSDYVLRTIRNEFDDADIEYDETYNPNESSERRTLIKQYCHTVDLTDWSDVRKLLKVFESVLGQLEESLEEPGTYTAENDHKVFDRLIKFLRRDGFIFRDGVLVSSVNVPGLDLLADVAEELDAAYLMKQIRTMEDHIETNPGLAIGTAKELVETVCKTILTERNVTFVDKANVPRLVRKTCAELKLTRDDVPDTAKAADTIRRLLSNLGTVSQGIAELRNPYGTGHGKHAKTKGLQPRHARLAVGAAATLASFLFETHRDQNSSE